jgi:hypothetical protein
MALCKTNLKKLFYIKMLFRLTIPVYTLYHSLHVGNIANNLRKYKNINNNYLAYINISQKSTISWEI